MNTSKTFFYEISFLYSIPLNYFAKFTPSVNITRLIIILKLHHITSLQSFLSALSNAPNNNANPANGLNRILVYLSNLVFYRLAFANYLL
ncbi:hypothetical protein SAMN04487900_11667 [Prevotella communis]|uniref:Uncharacterized protein n=1 Tax=Prevotella communis TaxID=2913614 RepID=A0A1H0IQZ2_9BACT|nr:hypothetical protein SAMN04487900_11667 [Prevotella communis]